MTPQSREEIERRLLRFIVEDLIEESYDGRDPLAAEAVDSLGIEQLAEYVEEEFGVRLEDEDMIAENFAGVPALAELVLAKRGAARA